MSKLLIGPN